MSYNVAHVVEQRKQGLFRSSSLLKQFRKLVHRRLSQIQYGTLRLTDELGTVRFGTTTDLQVSVKIHSLWFYEKMVLGGSIGVAESYMDGDWSSDDLVSLVRFMVRNRHLLDKMEGGLATFSNGLHHLYHLWNRNTIEGSKRNIIAHYDLGNDFYQQFLDETMTYSCGIFEKDTHTMKEASINKFKRICQKLQLKSTDHLLEIGTGWGGFAVYAVENYGCRVTTTTISEEQFAYTQDLIRQKGLEDKITLLKQDYRELSGVYDKIVSIEMIEAIGYQQIADFVQQCSRLLKPNGIVVLQAITIPDQVFDRYRKSTDFIQRYVFPGSCLISLQHFLSQVKRHTDLRLVSLEDIGIHYARTLREWRKRFLENMETIRSMGFSEPFLKMWDYYFAYCEGGFAEHYIGNSQLVLSKSQSNYDALPITGESI